MSDDVLSRCRLITLDVRGDERGSLVAVEAHRTAPFPIERIFYIFGTTPGVTRGLHAHRKLNEMAIAVSGACTITLDDGYNSKDVRLDDPSSALVIAPGVWRVMSDFTPDCVLLVLTDAPYDEADYIRDYDEFVSLVKR